VLIVGFGSLLAITAAAGIGALRVLEHVRSQDDTIRRQFLSRNHVLNDIRSEVYLSGTLVRDYLLEPEPERAETYRASLEEIRRQMDSALEAYAREIDPEDRAGPARPPASPGTRENSAEPGSVVRPTTSEEDRTGPARPPASPGTRENSAEREVAEYAALRTELAGYWETLAPVFQWDPAERGRLGYPFLRDEVFPRRQNMLAIAGRIAEINERQLTAGNAQVAGLLSGFQNRLEITLIAALGLGLGMAAFSIHQIVKLEAREQARFEEVAGARGQLEELSARLVNAQETERRALSRELHDEVGQSLSAVLVELRNLSSAIGVRATEETRVQVDVIKGLVENTVRVVRNMALLLRPSMLDDLGLVPALRWQAREVSKSTAMDVSVAAELTSDDFPDEYKTCIYRVVQEALHNCTRHSHAHSVRIRVQQPPGRVTLSIQDDGQGFDASQIKGLGLLGIQERVHRLGGACRVHSEPGKGTELTVELPFSPAGRASEPALPMSHV
jgi:signal transduction histidine kinase